MKAVEAIFLLALFCVLVGAALLYGARAVGRLLARRRQQHAPWQLTEHSDGEQVCVYAERPGERLLVGAAPFAAQDFDLQLYELRNEGDLRTRALNENHRH